MEKQKSVLRNISSQLEKERETTKTTGKTLANEARKHFLFTVWTFAKYVNDCEEGVQPWDEDYALGLLGIADSAMNFINITDGRESRPGESFAERMECGLPAPMFGKLYGIMLKHPCQVSLSDEERELLDSIDGEGLYDRGCDRLAGGGCDE